MATYNQLNRGARKQIKKFNRGKIKLPCAVRVLCKEVKTTSPKKPNSANRGIIKGQIFGTHCIEKKYGQTRKIKLTGKMFTAKIGGEGHNLKEYSVVLIRRRNSKDLPGVNYEVIRGVLDAAGVSKRRQARSRYGAKRPEEDK